jgi:DNA primase
LNRERCIEILRNDFNIQEIKPNSQGWVKVRCILPGHNDKHPSAAFNLNNGIYNCFSCHTTTNIYKLTSQLKNISYSDAVKYIDGEIDVEQAPLNNLQNRNIETIEQQVFDRKARQFFNTTPLLNPENYEYTKLRGFTFDFCDEFNIQLALNGFYKDYIIIPIRNKFYNLDTFEARKLCQLEYLQKWFESKESLKELEKKFSALKEQTHIKIKEGAIVDKDGLTSTNPTLYYLLRTKVLYEANSALKSILWNIDNLDYEKDLIVCEGFGSIPKIYQYYSTNVTCTFGSKISDEQILLLNEFKGKKIFLSDWDEPSYSMLTKIRNYVENVFVFSEKSDDTDIDFVDKLNKGYIEVSRFLLNIFYL